MRQHSRHKSFWNVGDMVSSNLRRLCLKVLWLVPNTHIHWVLGCCTKTCKMCSIWIKRDTSNERFQMAIWTFPSCCTQCLIPFIKNIGCESLRIYSFFRLIFQWLPILPKRSDVKFFGSWLGEGSLDDCQGTLSTGVQLINERRRESLKPS